MIERNSGSPNIDSDWQQAYYDGADLDDATVPELSWGGVGHDSSVETLFDDPDVLAAEAWDLDEAEAREDAAQTARKGDIERIGDLDEAQRNRYAWSVGYGSMNMPNFMGQKEPKPDPKLTDIVLLRRAQSGDVVARNRITVRYLGLLAKLAVGWFGPEHLYRDDLFQSGVAGAPTTSKTDSEIAGLVGAINGYEAARGVALSTYTTNGIKTAFNRAVANYDREIRIPAWLLDRLSSVKKMKDSLERYSQNVPADRSELVVAAEKQGMYIGLAEKLVDEFLLLPTADAGLDRIAPDMLASEEPGFAEVEDADWLVSTIQRLRLLPSTNEEQIEILWRCLGLFGDKPKILDQVAEDLGVSRSTIQRGLVKIIEVA